MLALFLGKVGTVEKEAVMKRLQEKELFIEPKALECIAEHERGEELLQKVLEKIGEQFVVTHQLVDEILESERAEKKAVQIVVEQASGFIAPAKDAPARIRFKDEYDVTNKSRSTGNIEDFVKFFQDRFKRISSVLRGRPSENGVVKISRLKEQQQKNARIIGIVNSVRETKNKHLLIEIEDEEAEANCLIPAGSRIFAKGKEILLDEVLAFDGYQSNGLFIVKEIIWPELEIREKKLAQEDLNIAFLSDLHIGSRFFLSEQFEKFLRFLRGEGDEWQTQVAGKIKYLVVAGDLVDGVGVYPTQEKQLVTKDIYTQYEIFAEYAKAIPEYIEVIIIPGNHDAVRNAEPQPKLGEEFAKELKELRNIHLLGNPACLEIEELKTLVYHGTSADTIIANMNLPGGYQNPEKVAIEMLKRRHLSPVYGDKPIVPEERDYMVVDEAPDIFHFGHVHKNGYADYRGTTIINSGAWQSTTDYQLRQGHVPSPCQLPVYNVKTGNLSVIRFM